VNHEIGTTFESVESAHEFVRLLSEAVADAKKDIAADVQREANSKFPRRLDALRIALYNLEKLEMHMTRSRRILNDLRSLRRLLFEERGAEPLQRGARTAVRPEKGVTVGSSVPLPPANGDRARSQTALAA